MKKYFLVLVLFAFTTVSFSTPRDTEIEATTEFVSVDNLNEDLSIVDIQSFEVATDYLVVKHESPPGQIENVIKVSIEPVYLYIENVPYIRYNVNVPNGVSDKYYRPPNLSVKNTEYFSSYLNC